VVWQGYPLVKQFGREDLEYIFAVSHEMHDMVDHIGTFDLLKGKILANLFYEPSTRNLLLIHRGPWNDWAARSSRSTT